ncbi:MAG: DUF3788 family protein [Gemmatimonadales bacterium]
MGRSSAFWAGNRYLSEAEEPAPGAPLHDLPAAAAGRFRALQSGLLGIDGVTETVRFMGATWRWAWEYGMGNRKLCWLHVVRDDISATFTLSDAEEGRLRTSARLSSDVLRAVEEGQRTGPVKWCWLELGDRRAIDTFLRLARRKAGWIAERPAPHRTLKLRARSAEDDEIEAE